MTSIQHLCDVIFVSFLRFIRPLVSKRSLDKNATDYLAMLIGLDRPLCTLRSRIITRITLKELAESTDPKWWPSCGFDGLIAPLGLFKETRNEIIDTFLADRRSTWLESIPFALVAAIHF
jgi:hypothetical protein